MLVGLLIRTALPVAVTAGAVLLARLQVREQRHAEGKAKQSASELYGAAAKEGQDPAEEGAAVAPRLPPRQHSRGQLVFTQISRCLRLYAAASLHSFAGDLGTRLLVRLLRSHRGLDLVLSQAFAHLHTKTISGSVLAIVGRRLNLLALRLLPSVTAGALEFVPLPRSKKQAPLPHPVLAQATLLAAKLTSGRALRCLLGPRALGQHEVVPISGRRRSALAVQTATDRRCVMEEGGVIPHGSLGFSRKGATVLALPPAHPSVKEATAAMQKLWAAGRELIAERQGSGSATLAAYSQRWEGRDIGLEVVAEIVPLESFSDWEECEAGGDFLGVSPTGGSVLGLADAAHIIVGKDCSPAILAHELAHIICRHGAEAEDLEYEQQLTGVAAGVVGAALAPLWALPATAPGFLGLLQSAALRLCADRVQGWLDMRAGARLRSNGSSLALQLRHELEAEQVAMLLLGRAGFNPGAGLKDSGARDWLAEFGGGDVEEGLRRLAGRTGSAFSTISGVDRAQQWPDAPKQAWALAQVFGDAQAEYKKAQKAAAPKRAAEAAAQRAAAEQRAAEAEARRAALAAEAAKAVAAAREAAAGAAGMGDVGQVA